MKRIFMMALVLFGCFAASAEGDWKTTLAKVKTLSLAVKRDLSDEEYTKIYHEVVG